MHVDTLLSPESVSNNVTDLLIVFKSPQITLFTSVEEIDLVISDQLAISIKALYRLFCDHLLLFKLSFGLRITFTHVGLVETHCSAYFF